MAKAKAKTKKVKGMTPIQILQAVEKQILEGTREQAELRAIVSNQGKRILDLEAIAKGLMAPVQHMQKAVGVIDPRTGGNPNPEGTIIVSHGDNVNIAGDTKIE